ncbi:MAG TPA: GNAT family N-acetyltransferase [Solirubrobacteraceae bacterium]|jgi:predicted GNAT family N-acyltransferase
MRLVELNRLSESSWDELVACEHEPFGSIGEKLVWREKTRNIGVRDDGGYLVAAAGVVLAEVKVGQEPSFEVAGLGGLIVTRSARGHGLASLLCKRLLEIASELEARRAMLFCRPKLMPLYEKFGFVEIDEPVWADQPGGRIEMPLPAMWSALSGDTSWPPGPVELLGEPF